MKLSTLQARTIPAKADLYGETLTMEVRPNQWTTALLNSDGSLADGIATVVESWDLENEGEPVPVTAAAITEHLGLPVQRLIWKGIAETFSPN